MTGIDTAVAIAAKPTMTDVLLIILFLQPIEGRSSVPQHLCRGSMQSMPGHNHASSRRQPRAIRHSPDNLQDFA
ncbi:hypothetical protein ACFOD4_19105 [Pseudoroseomonas globiformis]|uniref:Uncharacterized protein n=1 Tax=Teichococcus globiformis TaxID=2307229 RepID=A0ABV7G993_9PROT